MATGAEYDFPRIIPASNYYPSLAEAGRVWRCRFPTPFNGGYLYVTVDAWTKQGAWEKAIAKATAERQVFMVPAKLHATRLKSQEEA